MRPICEDESPVAKRRLADRGPLGGSGAVEARVPVRHVALAIAPVAYVNEDRAGPWSLGDRLVVQRSVVPLVRLIR